MQVLWLRCFCVWVETQLAAAMSLKKEVWLSAVYGNLRFRAGKVIFSFVLQYFVWSGERSVRCVGSGLNWSSPIGAVQPICAYLLYGLLQVVSYAKTCIERISSSSLRCIMYSVWNSSSMRYYLRGEWVKIPG